MVPRAGAATDPDEHVEEPAADPGNVPLVVDHIPPGRVQPVREAERVDVDVVRGQRRVRVAPPRKRRGDVGADPIPGTSSVPGVSGNETPSM